MPTQEMNMRLKDTLKRLKSLGYTPRPIALGEPTLRTRDVAARKDLDVNVNQTVKTILFKSKKQGVFSVSVMGHDRIDYKKIKDIIGDKNISTLRPEEMRTLGWEPGECCPLSVPGPLYVDTLVLTHEKINTGSGDLYFGLEFPSNAIQEYRDDCTIASVREEKEL